MAAGNEIGFTDEQTISAFRERYVSFLVESPAPLQLEGAVSIGKTYSVPNIEIGSNSLLLRDLLEKWQSPSKRSTGKADSPHPAMETFRYHEGPRIKAPKESVARPLAIIPAFPGTNSEYDSARSIRDAGGEAEIIVFRNLTSDAVDESLQALANAIRRAQILFIPGGFSAGDEPDGSGKFIATVLRSPVVRDAVMELLTERDGLALGICTASALIKTGSPYGEIRSEPDAPTLTFNDIGRHVPATSPPARLQFSPCFPAAGSMTRIISRYPMAKASSTPSEQTELAANGQVATIATTQERPGWTSAITSTALFRHEDYQPLRTSPWQMAHFERRGCNVARNIREKHSPFSRVDRLFP